MWTCSCIACIWSKHFFIFFKTWEKYQEHAINQLSKFVLHCHLLNVYCLHSQINSSNSVQKKENKAKEKHRKSFMLFLLNICVSVVRVPCSKQTDIHSFKAVIENTLPSNKLQQWQSSPEKIALPIFLYSLPPLEQISSPLKFSLRRKWKEFMC